MSVPPSTPRRQTHATATTTPQTSRVSTSHVVQSSPHYQTTRRHSLYGTEDRVVIDPGSTIWKVGFSGEGKPRDVFSAGGEKGRSLWSLSRAMKPDERAEEDILLEARMQTLLRAVFHDSLMTDPKSRKVILVEHPLLPLHVKDIVARILFDNLQVPSISFASSHLLGLLAAGRITGLVLDCGHLESTVLPIFSSRPLFHQLRTTPLAGARFSSHIHALLLMFGTYLPPPTSLSAAANIPAAARSTRVPQEVLTPAVIEEIKTRCCFVGEALDTSEMRFTSAGDDSLELELPPSDPAMSESEFSRVSGDMESASALSSQQAASSGYSVVSHSHIPIDRPRPEENHLQALATLYMRHSTATDLHLRVDPPVAQNTNTGRGTLIVPGWIRERAAEVLFEGGDVDEASVAEVLLDCLLHVPVDLRRTLAGSILVVGGTAMLPGFVPRLHAELVRAIEASAPMAVRPPGRQGRVLPQPYDRYAPLRPLIPHFAILNNPAPPPPTSVAGSSSGRAPAFTPASMAWAGGSLAGALKIGGAEIPREKWDQADVQGDGGDAGEIIDIIEPLRSSKSILPDWTRSPLPVGAPHVSRASTQEL